MDEPEDKERDQPENAWTAADWWLGRDLLVGILDAL